MVIEGLMKKPIHIEGNDTTVRGIYWLDNLQKETCSCYIMTAYEHDLNTVNYQIRYTINFIDIDNNKVNEFIDKGSSLGEKGILTNIFLLANEEIKRLKVENECILSKPGGEIKSNKEVPNHLENFFRLDVSLLDSSEAYFKSPYMNGAFSKDISRNAHSLITEKEFQEVVINEIAKKWLPYVDVDDDGNIKIK